MGQALPSSAALLQRMVDAVEQGQHFTWHTLAASRRLGMGNRIPNRMYWADRNAEDLSYQTDGS